MAGIGKPILATGGASIDLQISGAQSVSGTVFLEGSIPAANAILRAWDATGVNELNATISAADGTFEWSNAPEGNYRITASVPGYTTIVWPDAACPGPCAAPGSLGSVVEPRQALDPIVVDFVLPRRAEVFADGFEQGDTAAWSHALP